MPQTTDPRQVFAAHADDLERCIPMLREHGLEPTADEFAKAVVELRAALAVPLVAEAPREMGDAAIERLAGEYIAEDWEPDRYYRDMNVIAFARALLASVAPQPEQPNTDSVHLVDNGEQAVQGLDAAAGVGGSAK